MSNKEIGMNFWAIVVLWMIFSFAVLWFIGGACTDIVHGSNCLAPNALAGLSGVPIVNLLLPFDTWSSLMYFVMPIVGFIMAVILILWWNSYFETSEASGLIFPLLLLVALLLGYYINLSFYVGEAATLNSNTQVKYSLSFCFSEVDSQTCNANVYKINQQLISQAQTNKATSIVQYIPVAFWAELRKSAFLLFVLGAIAGWVPLFAKEVYSQHFKSN